ncbi:MAG: hypothetical protein MI746_07070 [Pseudomonadales bacterium]|nr:hypothetical protein [Pseudomonadales bacterium]
METELNLVIAHKLEAKPLIALFDMRQISRDPAIYEGSKLRLIVSGQGQHWAQEAVNFLAQQNQAQTIQAWMNIGIAGHQTLDLGRPLLANKIINRSSGEAVYPAPLLAIKQVGELHTVDEPELNYPQNVAYDMEAFGFFQAATAHTNLELVQSLKIISDNLAHSADRITPDKVLQLFQTNTDLINSLVADLQSLRARMIETQLDTPEFARFSEQVHLTATQRVQVQRLCQRYYAFGIQQRLSELLTPNTLGTLNGRELVRRLRLPLLEQE